MQSFSQIVQNIRETSVNAKQAGTKFEILVLRWFLATPLYKSKRGWLWADFAKAVGKDANDLGIDLVLEMHDGEFWAVQCKFYNKSSRVDEDKIAHFLGHQGMKFTIDRKSRTFTRFVWVDTDAVWGRNAEKYVHGRDNFTRLSMSVLANSNVDWEAIVKGNQAHVEPKKPRDYQKEVIHKAEAHFKNNERGKVIMACGTGKTLTSQRIAEAVAGTCGTLVLYCVPSIALLGQTYQSWAENAQHTPEDTQAAPLFAIGVCSDNRALEKTDHIGEATIDSPLPATTSVTAVYERILAARQMQKEGMSVVFTTYQSLQVVADAQQMVLDETKGAFGVFDMIICDEAHRTTGAAKDGFESSFMKIHDNGFIQAKKRLYMTATPRIYTVNAKSEAKKAASDAVVCSMDDAAIYGEEIARISFGQAVNLGCLSDYKVIILTVNPKDLPEKVVSGFERADKLLDLPTATRLVGAIHGLSKQLVGDGGRTLAEDPKPCTRALVFASEIGNVEKLGSSKNIEAMFPEVSKLYLKSKTSAEERLKYVSVEAKHVDGTMNSSERNAILSWLAGEDGTETKSNVCRVVSNVRCLSEGVDVPALDAVVFMAPKRSQIDIVQSVGRVMRNFRRGQEGGKKYGYIILPVALRPGENIHEALEEGDRFKEVWSVLCALRSHDENFNAQVNAIRLNMADSSEFKAKAGTFDPESGKFIVGTTGNQRNPIEDNADDLQMSDEQKAKVRIARQLELFEPDQQKIFAKLVDKVGTRNYWEGWASDVGKVALDIIAHMHDIIERHPDVQKAFDRYHKGLQKNINQSIDRDQAAEMLGQHIIVGPIFDALFANYHFNENNAVSKTLARMVKKLQDHGLGKDTTILNTFYASIRNQVGDITSPAARQSLIKELYNRFFAVTFPKTVQRLGIVYTPVECVDFILHSVEALMQKEFGRSLSDENVHILDPFVGTGTFITRLLQSGIIKDKDLKRKYLNELHCNEIVLLAYYVADVNIETVFHSLHATDKYINYNNICLTDTFELYERGQRTIDDLFKENTEQIERQCKAPIQVIIGNPPYSAKQANANDNNQNLKYEKLDRRIEETYVAGSKSTNKTAMYDSYIRAFRWASDRIAQNPNGGIIGFITNGGWIEGNAAVGMRQALVEEFDSIYVLDLRGDARTQGVLRKQEGGNVFESGSRAKVCMTFLVKHGLTPNPSQKERDFIMSGLEGEVSPCAAISQAKYAATPSASPARVAGTLSKGEGMDSLRSSKSHQAKIYYYSVDDYMSREDKLNFLVNKKSIAGISGLTPNPSPTERGFTPSASPARVAGTLSKGEGMDSLRSSERHQGEGGVSKMEFKTSDKKMWLELKDRARKNRKEPTEAENVLWQAIRNKKLGVTFRRQHPIHVYIADFVCLERMLVVELDGGYHLEDNQQYIDKQRTQDLNALGYRVIRFTNDDVLHHLPDVLQKLSFALSPDPLGSGPWDGAKVPLSVGEGDLGGEAWQQLTPDEHGDWLNKRLGGEYDKYPRIGDKKDKAGDADKVFCDNYSQGLNTARGVWCYNYSMQSLKNNISSCIDFYNSESLRTLQLQLSEDDLINAINYDPTKFKWDRAQKEEIGKKKGLQYKYRKDRIFSSIYRPFVKLNCYFARELNNCVYQLPQVFPYSDQNDVTKEINRCICLSGLSSKKVFSCIMTDCVPDLNLMPASVQCFPLYVYNIEEKLIKQSEQRTLFGGGLKEQEDSASQFTRSSGITDWILDRTRKQYGHSDITKEDIFYYVYGILHCPSYREKYQNDFKKALPRIPFVERYEDFVAFMRAGRELGDLHCNYEECPMNETAQIVEDGSQNYIIDKLRPVGKGNFTELKYNGHITIKNIPPEAHEYIVNGRSPLGWIIDQYQVKIDKDSGIKNDPNDWCREHNNPRYILELILRVIEVSVRTVRIVKGLPKVEV